MPISPRSCRGSTLCGEPVRILTDMPSTRAITPYPLHSATTATQTQGAPVLCVHCCSMCLCQLLFQLCIALDQSTGFILQSAQYSQNSTVQQPQQQHRAGCQCQARHGGSVFCCQPECTLLLNPAIWRLCPASISCHITAQHSTLQYPAHTHRFHHPHDVRRDVLPCPFTFAHNAANVQCLCLCALQGPHYQPLLSICPLVSAA